MTRNRPPLMAHLESAKTRSDKIVVGIDFGTTFSGVAFQYCGSDKDPDKIVLIKSWPGGDGLTTEKVPTTLLYKDNISTAKWGYEIPPGEPPMRCIKLLLDDATEFPAWIDKDQLRKKLAKLGRSATDVAADFLTKIHEFAIGEMSATYGAVFVKTIPIEYILTVPAVWSDAAKQATLTAAKQAGITGEIHLISERSECIWTPESFVLTLALATKFSTASTSNLSRALTANPGKYTRGVEWLDQEP